MFETVISFVAGLIALFVFYAFAIVTVFILGATGLLFIAVVLAGVLGSIIYWSPVYLFPFAAAHAICIGFKVPKWYLGVCDQAGSV